MACTQDIRIRAATMADYDAICRLTAQADRYHAEVLPGVFRAAEGPARSRDAIDPGADYLVAEMDGKVVGFLNLKEAGHPEYPILRPRTFAAVENLVVDAGLRRRGIATALLEAARAWARVRGLDSIQLTVWAANAPALALYRKEGFRPLTYRMELRLDDAP